MRTQAAETPANVRVDAPVPAAYAGIITPAALDFVAQLTRQFRLQVDALLARRVQVQAAYDDGYTPKFLSETVGVRQGTWEAAPLPPDLLDRRVEITGPPAAKMIINALNCGANVYMADFEDSCAPTWDNLVGGQVHLAAAVRRTLRVDDPNGKTYELNPKTATLVVRPRGWHLWEQSVMVDDGPIPAGLFDFGLFLFHNAQEQVMRGAGSYFYLPKMQSHLEARLWNDVFVWSQNALDLKPRTIKATVLIETLPAAFEMDEIIYELREHIAGLNCGRWDYIFSSIKTRRADPQALFPDRKLVGMTQPAMRAYSQLLVQTCHKRGVHAMGGMAAQIPIKNDAAANDKALEQVRADKLREVTDGHDGTWVAHPGLVSIAKDVFDQHMPEANQIKKSRPPVSVMAEDLLAVPAGDMTLAGLRNNVDVGVRYLAAWIGGNGCVPIHNLMEDAATAEISRSQVWQWLHHGARLDGRELTEGVLETVVEEETGRIAEEIGKDAYKAGHYDDAKRLFWNLSTAPQLADFLTLEAQQLMNPGPA